jgi:hypothetical protein
MEWLAGTVVGFALIVALVVILGRGSTGRWEREKRVAARPRVRLARPPAAVRRRPDVATRRARRMGHGLGRASEERRPR